MNYLTSRLLTKNIYQAGVLEVREAVVPKVAAKIVWEVGGCC